MTKKLLIIVVLALLAVPVFAQEAQDEPPECPAFEDSAEDVRIGYYMGEGEGFTRSGQVQAAILSYTCIIETIDDDYLPAYINRAVLYTQRREYEEAIEDYSAIIQRDSSLEAAFNNRGIVFFLLAEYEAAMNDFDEALDLDDGMVIALNNRAVLHALLDDYDAALEDLDSAVAASGIESIVAELEDPDRSSDAPFPEFEREAAVTYALRGLVRSLQAVANYQDYRVLSPGGGDARIQSAAGALESRFSFELRLDDGSWLMTASFFDGE